MSAGDAIRRDRLRQARAGIIRRRYRQLTADYAGTIGLVLDDLEAADAEHGPVIIQFNGEISDTDVAELREKLAEAMAPGRLVSQVPGQRGGGHGQDA